MLCFLYISPKHNLQAFGNFYLCSENTLELVKKEGHWLDSVGELDTSMCCLVVLLSVAAPGNPDTFGAGVELADWECLGLVG